MIAISVKGISDLNIKDNGEYVSVSFSTGSISSIDMTDSNTDLTDVGKDKQDGLKLVNENECIDIIIDEQILKMEEWINLFHQLSTRYGVLPLEPHWAYGSKNTFKEWLDSSEYYAAARLR